MDEKVFARAKNNAYALLRQRPRSRYEIRRRLKLKGYGEEVIDEVVSRLEKAGELDDMRFAQCWIDSRMRLNPAGDVVLRYELKEKGVIDSVIEAALSERKEKYDEYEAAFSMAKERFERFKKLDRRKAAKRVYDFLVRRGFKYDTIQKIIDQMR